MNTFPALAPLAENYDGGGGEIWTIGFVAQLSATLDVRYASRIAGESGYSIAVDSTGQAFIPTYRSSASGVLVAVAPDGAGWGPELALGDGLVSASAAAIDANDTLYLAGYGAFARIGAPAPQPPVVQPPAYTKSYYIQTVDPKVNRYMGCVARQNGEWGVAILGFGRPIKRGAEYGASLIPVTDSVNVPDFVSINVIKTAVQAFADGYSRLGLCQREFGLRAFDPELKPRKLIIAVGTTNSPLNGERDPNSDLTFDHGRAWGQMVIDVNSYTVRSQYTGIKVTGAYDAEPKWAAKQALDGKTGNERTLDWARGFASLDSFVSEGQVQSQGLIYYNYGSLDGGIRNSSWVGKRDPNFDFVYELSRGISVARPLPQIYTFRN